MRNYANDPMVKRALELLGDAPSGAHLISQIRQEFSVSKGRATTIVAHAMRARRQSETVPPVTQSTESPFDFDGGFGIGGLGRYEEKPIVPSVKALERYERMQARATVCRRCGQSDVFDGAMFTTLGGDICDDCAG